MRILPLVAATVFLAAAGFGQGIPNPASFDVSQSGTLPFSFKYAGEKTRADLKSWKTRVEGGQSGGPTRIFYVDPATHLMITAEVREYADFNAVEWTLWFKNTAATDTPIIEDIEPLDWIAEKTGDVTLHHAQGSKAEVGDFKPLTDLLPRGRSFQMESTGGRSSQGSLPFFNLQTGGGGIVGAIGWTGHWSATFSSAGDGGSVRLTAGMKRTHLILHPGEEIRTPRIVLMSWKGTDWIAAQNRWRRLMLARYTVQEDGKPLVGPISYGTWGADTTAHKLAQIKLVKDEHLPFDIFWIDASWYDKCVGHLDTDSEPFWRGRGSWVPNPANYPLGLKPIGEMAHAAGMKFLLWLEPEEADPGTLLRKEHPDWFFPATANNPGSAVLKMGDPSARAGITDLVSRILSESGVDWYRQDYNLDPERTLFAADTPDRVGITEIRYVEGLYAFLDELKRRHPGLKIDNCASGGQRLDIEMLSRSTPLWRSDMAGPPDGDIHNQTQTQGIAEWIPLNGCCPWTTPGPFDEDQAPPDPYDSKLIYTLRSGYSGAMVLGIGQAAGKDHAWCARLRKQLDEYKEVQPYVYGDFYPLLEYSAEPTSFVAWQWDRPDLNGGVVIALRRSGCANSDVTLNLDAIDPVSSYQVEVRAGLEKGAVHTVKGSDLARLNLRIDGNPGSVLVLYRKRG